MSFDYHEDPPNPSNKCTTLTSTLKEVFTNCSKCHRRVPTPKREEKEDSWGEVDDEQEVVVSEIRSRAMEAKSRRKASFTTKNFNWVFSSKIEELLISPEEMKRNEGSEHEEINDFFSVGTSFSRCSSARSTEPFLSVKTNFSRSSSLSSLDRRDFQTLVDQVFDSQGLRWRSIISRFCYCEGWPFGLCRKALLLPPLPKSPSESWSWRKRC